MANQENYSDYIIYIDESGDHGLQSIDSQFPIFALVFVVIKKSDYIDTIVPAFQKLKLDFWGHDQVIFHEHDIRRGEGVFGLLRTNPHLRGHFLEELSRIIMLSQFKYAASIIHKEKLIKQYKNPYNPYEIGLLFCMERMLEILIRHEQKGKKCHLVVESRGVKEDRELKLEFLDICNNRGDWGYKRSNFKQMNFDIIFSDKKCNSSGLQLADLIARPIALRYLRPDQPNQTYNILREKNYATKGFP